MYAQLDLNHAWRTIVHAHMHDNLRLIVQWEPNVTLSANLPSLRFHVDEQKVSS